MAAAKSYYYEVDGRKVYGRTSRNPLPIGKLVTVRAYRRSDGKIDSVRSGPVTAQQVMQDFRESDYRVTEMIETDDGTASGIMAAFRSHQYFSEIDR